MADPDGQRIGRVVRLRKRVQAEDRLGIGRGVVGAGPRNPVIKGGRSEPWEAHDPGLEREHGFLYVSDDRLSAAVNVSKQEDDNFLAEIDSELDDEDDDEDDTDANGRADADYVTIRADLDFDRGSRTN